MSTTYRDAALKLWGEAGGYVHDAYTKHLPLFDNLPNELPIVIGLSAYGHCIGHTRVGDAALDGPRITIASNTFASGTTEVSDVMLHEMMHVSLHLRGQSMAHAGEPWYRLCRDLAPHVLGEALNIKRGSGRKSVRIENPKYNADGPDTRKTLVRKVSVEGGTNHADVARFPYSYRPAGTPTGRIIDVPTY